MSSATHLQRSGACAHAAVWARGPPSPAYPKGDPGGGPGGKGPGAMGPGATGPSATGPRSAWVTGESDTWGTRHCPPWHSNPRQRHRHHCYCTRTRTRGRKCPRPSPLETDREKGATFSCRCEISSPEVGTRHREMENCSVPLLISKAKQA